MATFFVKLLVFISICLNYNITWTTAVPETKESVPPPAVSAEKLMGIEIETSAVKIHSPDKDHKIGFTITTPFRKTWMIEEDTSDNTFATTPPYEVFDQNLEFKTIGGFNGGEIMHVSGDMQHLLVFFHTRATPALEIDAAELSGLLKGLEVIPKPGNPPKVSLKSKTEDRAIRPQITYQMPLALLPQVFEHLGVLGHDKIIKFLDCLNPDIPPELSEAEIAKKLTHRLLMMRNAGHDKQVKLFLKRKIGPEVARLPTGNAKGFCYLLLYYWYVIFNDKENSFESSEPGPKKSLAILSRVPLSQLFDKLDDSDKAIVRGTLDPIIMDHGASFKITAYSNYDGVTISPPLTLRQWYGSVIEPRLRREVKGRHVDLLSPPPGLEDTGYSMGYLDIEKDASGLALIEVRGYATLPSEGAAPAIGNLQSLIGTEAHWFFSTLGG